VTPVANHQRADVAAALLAEQAERARIARSTAGPERWMQRLVTDQPGPPPG
jgi:putative membrane protein